MIAFGPPWLARFLKVSLGPATDVFIDTPYAGRGLRLGRGGTSGSRFCFQQVDDVRVRRRALSMPCFKTKVVMHISSTLWLARVALQVPKGPSRLLSSEECAAFFYTSATFVYATALVVYACLTNVPSLAFPGGRLEGHNWKPPPNPRTHSRRTHGDVIRASFCSRRRKGRQAPACVKRGKIAVETRVTAEASTHDDDDDDVDANLPRPHVHRHHHHHHYLPRPHVPDPSPC